MSIIAKVGAAMQVLLGTFADEVGMETGVIVRQRKFSCLSLARTFVLGFLQKPNASDEDLARIAAQCGADVTPQAVEQRHTSKLVKFLEGLFRRSITLVVGSDKALAPLLERFTEVTILDSSSITLPDSMEQQFQGCGGSYNGGKAALKLQVEFDLRGGALRHIEIEPGRSPDGATSRQEASYPRGSLRIADLGYFNLAVFASMILNQVYFLSRLQFGTVVRQADGVVVNLLPWLSKQTKNLVDLHVQIGKEQCLPCRLIAWRLPEEQANRRRQKLRKEALSRRNQEPSAERLAWCDWTILVTSVPDDLLTAREAIVLYRARWQVELLFKRWKSQDLVAALSGSTDVRQMVRVWARLLAAVVQHWLVVATSWGDPSRSWGKVSEAIRSFVVRLIPVLEDLDKMQSEMATLAAIVAKTCQRNKRSKPGTFELLNDVSLLDFSLT
jgi:hypothetical protein